MAQSLAERFRANREAFELALEIGCTPAEAAKELRRRAAIARSAESERRLQAKMRAMPSTAMRSGHDPEPPRQPWYQRED